MSRPTTPSFKDVDGVLFTKDGKTLVRYPVGKPATSYAIPDGTETIEECAFMQTATGMQQKPGKLQTVTFPRSLKQIKSGAFRPNAPITREQFVAILYRYAAYKGLQTTAGASLSAFADAASVSGWAVDAVRWAVGSGLMNGKNGRIDPAGLTTRAEAAALLHRYLA